MKGDGEAQQDRVLALRYACRALAPVPSSDETVQLWVSGTHRLNQENEIRLIKFAETGALSAAPTARYHDQPIKHISSAGSGAIAVVDQLGCLRTFKVGKPGDEAIHEQWSGGGGPVERTAYSADGQLAIFGRGTTINILDSGYTQTQEIDTGRGDCWLQTVGTDLQWDPNNGKVLAVAMGKHVSVYDTRSNSRPIYHFLACQSPFSVLSFSFNPNLPVRCMTAGTDGVIRFHDIREPDKPLLTSGQVHQHWIWGARYNPFHDQLILSGGGDGTVVLSEFSSVSSSALFKEALDVEIATATDLQQESVYEVCWAWGDPWSWAAASYDGNIIVQTVPDRTKYNLLLGADD